MYTLLPRVTPRHSLRPGRMGAPPAASASCCRPSCSNLAQAAVQSMRAGLSGWDEPSSLAHEPGTGTLYDGKMVGEMSALISGCYHGRRPQSSFFHTMRPGAQCVASNAWRPLRPIDSHILSYLSSSIEGSEMAKENRLLYANKTISNLRNIGAFSSLSLSSVARSICT